jgi:hypothetical protein
MLMFTEKKYGWLDFLFDLNSSQSVLGPIYSALDAASYELGPFGQRSCLSPLYARL